MISVISKVAGGTLHRSKMVERTFFKKVQLNCFVKSNIENKPYRLNFFEKIKNLFAHFKKNPPDTKLTSVEQKILISELSNKKYNTFLQKIAYESSDFKIDRFVSHNIKTKSEERTLKLILENQNIKNASLTNIMNIVSQSKNSKYRNIIFDLLNKNKFNIPKTDIDKTFFESLYNIRKNSRRKYNKIVNSKELLSFLNSEHSKTGRFAKSSESLLDNLNVKNLSNAENIYKKSSQLYGDYQGYELTHLYFENPKIYEYLIKNPILIKEGIFKASSIEILKEIQKVLPGLKQVKQDFRHYIYSSSHVVGDEIQELNSIISKYKLSTDLIMYRGERGLGIFDKVSIKDNALAENIRNILFNNPTNAKNTTAKKFLPLFEKSCEDLNINLYDYIMSKKDLSLADAMQVINAGYTEDKLVQKVCNAIKGVSISDTKLKSVTYCEDFAKNWGINQAKLNIKKGTECMFINGYQSEFILGTNPRKITYTNAIYNPKTHSFNFEATVEPVKIN